MACPKLAGGASGVRASGAWGRDSTGQGGPRSWMTPRSNELGHGKVASSAGLGRMPRMAGRFIDVVSDSTGETAEKVVRAALLQFPQAGAVIRLHTRVRTKETARAILERASREGALFVFTVVSPELREYIHASTSELKVDAVDVIGSLIGKLGHFLDREPINMPSRMLPLLEEYFRRIEAVEFSVMSDGGKESRE